MRTARVRKTLDRLAYTSLVLDLCIAVVTTLSFFDLGNGQSLLVPISYLLTVVVVLSVMMFIVLLLLRAKERQAVKVGSPSPTPNILLVFSSG